MYCQKCGAQIVPESSFCTACGNPVAKNFGSTVSGYNPSPPVNLFNNTVTVSWVLVAQLKESLFKRKACSVVFMRDRLVIAHLSAQRQKEENSRITEEIKSEGKGFFKGSAAMMQYWANYHKKYYTMTPEQIQSEDPANFVVWYENIKKLIFKCETTDIDADGRSYGNQGSLDISLADGRKISFSHSCSNDSSIKKTLTDLFDSKLKYRK